MTAYGEFQVRLSAEKNLQGYNFQHFYCTDILRTLQCAVAASSALPNRNNGKSILAKIGFGWTGIPGLENYDEFEAMVKKTARENGEKETIALWQKVAPEMIDFTRVRFFVEMQGILTNLFLNYELAGDVYIASNSLVGELNVLDPANQVELREADIIEYVVNILVKDDEVAPNVIDNIPKGIEIISSRYIPKGF